MAADAQRSVSKQAGLYLAGLQLVFTLGWTVYVVYLPKLAASVGIAPASVILILMLDQAIFTVADTAMGIAADKLAPFVGRLGVVVGALTVVSCLAFVALPFVASVGPNAQVPFIVLIVIWAVTSSALRAPPLTLLGRYGARPALPFLAALTMLGYGLAGAVSPYLGGVLRDVDARLPFIVSSAVLLIVALSLSRVERSLAASAPVPKPLSVPKPLGAWPMLFIAATLLLALGYQLHSSLNSGALFLRFAKPNDLPWLLAVFWIGFNIAMFPASIAVKLKGGVVVMAVAGLVGAVGVYVAQQAASLPVLIGAQFVAGAAWGCMLASAVSAALAIGHTGAEGKVVGLVFSALALATFARMAAVAGGMQKMPDYAPLLQWAPVACWLVAGLGLVVLAATHLRGRASAVADG